MLTWVVTALYIVFVVGLVTLVGILFRIRAELRSLRRTAGQQLPILLRTHRVVVGIQSLVNSGGLGLGVPQPEFACELPVSPSGQWPSLESLIETEIPAQEGTPV